MQRKVFYPWTEYQLKDWLEQNKDRIRVSGQMAKDYTPRGESKPTGQQTTIFYEEIK